MSLDKPTRITLTICAALLWSLLVFSDASMGDGIGYYGAGIFITIAVSYLVWHYTE